MNKLICGVCFAALLLPAVARADANLDMATEKRCMICHTLGGEAKHAPSFKAIARKYRSHDNAEAVLAGTIMQGNPVTGGYHWGLMPEPSPGGRSPVSEAEARQLAHWILGIR